MDREKWLIVGLGNVGDKYLRTRHNLGFMCLEVLCQIWNLRLKKIKFKGIYEKVNFAEMEQRVSESYKLRSYGRKALPAPKDIEVLLLKPSTFMNRSGESVKEAMDYFKIPTERLIVIYDDFDLNVGELRLRSKGGAGTHNGMRSIISSIKSENFIRLRVGCGPISSGEDIISYVMQDIPKSEQADTFASLELGAKMLRLILLDGVESALNAINTEKQKLAEQVDN